MIPKIIHLCWLSGDPYPALIGRCLDSWKDKLPDYQVMLWDKKSFDVTAVPWVAEATARRKFAFAADYIRLHALYHHGGIYLDADVEVLHDFSNLLATDSFIGFETGGDLEPAVIGAKPGQTWVGRCLEYYKGRHFVRPDGSLDQEPLPMIIGNVLRAHYGLIGEVSRRELLLQANLTLMPYTCFSPKNLHTGKIALSRDTYCIHHFDGQWVERTWKHQLKQALHGFLLTVLGTEGHKKTISTIRKIKSWKSTRF